MTTTTPTTTARVDDAAGRRALPLLLTAIVVAAPACASQEDAQVTPPVVLAMTDKIAPFYEDDEVKLYQVSLPVSLPMRRPTDGERAALGKEAPYGRTPFFKAGDVRVTVRFTLSNLDAQARTVELLLDPWNEVVRYRPGLAVAGERAAPNPSGIDRYFVLPPRSRIEGILTPDDMRELAIDLATAEAIEAKPPPADGGLGGPRLYNRAFDVQNRSTVFDPLITPYIPPTIAGLVGFDLGLRARGPMNVAVEIVVDLEDRVGDRLLPVGSTEKPFGPPGRSLTPPAGT